MSLCFHCLQFCSLPLHSSFTLGAFKQPPLSCFWLKKPKPRQRLLLAPRHLKAPPQGRASGRWLKKPTPRPPKVFAEKAKSRRVAVRCPLRVQSTSSTCSPMAFGGVLTIPFSSRISALRAYVLRRRSRGVRLFARVFANKGKKTLAPNPLARPLCQLN